MDGDMPMITPIKAGELLPILEKNGAWVNTHLYWVRHSQG